VQRRSGVCFLISDFICSNFFHKAALATKQFDLVPIAIVDLAEIKFPHMGLVALRDLETGISHLVDTTSMAAQTKLKKSTDERISTLKKQLEKLGTTLCLIQTHLPYLQQLKNYFLQRFKR
jgi:hypothetical protein